MKIKKELKIEKSIYPDDTGKYILFLHNKTEHGESWKRLFKGSRKECLIYRKEIENEE